MKGLISCKLEGYISKVCQKWAGGGLDEKGKKEKENRETRMSTDDCHFPPLAFLSPFDLAAFCVFSIYCAFF